MEKSRTKRYLILFVVFAILGFASTFLYEKDAETKDVQIPDNPKVVIGDDTFSALIADTPTLQKQGLSGRPSLEADEGMLFIFDKSEVHNFWMKEMYFPIDIIWIDENFTITGIVENALPESYPELFNSEVPVKYVLEINAGESQKRGIIKGDVVTLLID